MQKSAKYMHALWIFAKMKYNLLELRNILMYILEHTDSYEIIHCIV